MDRLVTPEQLATKHPRLYHLTSPEALDGIRRHGLLSTRQLLDLFEVDDETRLRLEQKRRAKTATIEHPRYGRAFLTDNVPLSEKSLAKCLEDGLSPQDWLQMLNSRVFFWPDIRGLGDLAQAKLNPNRERIILVLDTLHWSGATSTG